METVINTEGDKTIRKTIEVTAEDGTYAEYKLIIRRKEDDLRLNSVHVDGRLVNKVDDKTYKIDVLKGKETINISGIAVADDEYVQIADMEEELKNSIFEDYMLEEGETVIPIKVLSDDKERYAEYNLVITRVNSPEELSDLGLTIMVDGTEIIRDDTGEYIAIVRNSATQSSVEAIASSKTTRVQIKDGEFVLRRDIKDITLEGLVTKVPITVENAEGIRRTVILNITKISDDNSIKEVKANDRIGKQNEDGTYTVYVDQDCTGAKLQVTANMELARVSINGNKETRGVNIETIDTSSENVTIAKVKVTALNGDVKEYTVYIEKCAKVEGKVITQAIEEKGHVAVVKAYRKEDTREENEESDPREVIDSCETTKDGRYELQLPAGEYDIVIEKTSYLEHRVTNVIVESNEAIEIEDIKIYAGDINKDGQIELSDMTVLTINTGEVTEENGKEIYDLNEDGVVDRIDRNMLKANYNKMKQEEKWEPSEEILRARNGNKFILPVKGNYVISSKYEADSSIRSSLHTGIDIVPQWHTEIIAVGEGEIVFAGDGGAFGNAIEIKHMINGKEIYSFYAHLSRIDVKVGDKVGQGQVIGLEGGAETDPNHGNSTGHHLHFEIRENRGYGNDLNPNDYINF